MAGCTATIEIGDETLTCNRHSDSAVLTHGFRDEHRSFRWADGASRARPHYREVDHIYCRARERALEATLEQIAATCRQYAESPHMWVFGTGESNVQAVARFAQNTAAIAERPLDRGRS